MEEEKPKIQLLEEQFVRALREGKAFDINGKEHDFCVYERVDIANQKIIAYKIEMIEVKEDILARRIICDKRLTLSHCDFNNLHIMDSEFNESIELLNITSKGTLSIARAKLKSISVTNGDLLRMSLMDSFIEDSIGLLGCKIETDISIVSCIVSGYIHFHTTQIENSIYLSGSQINNIHFNNISFKTLAIPSIPENGTVKLQTIHFESLYTDDNFTNLGYMKWSNFVALSSGSKIEIMNSMMGKWDIINCNFSETTMIFFGSKITDAFYTNTHFPAILHLPNGAFNEKLRHEILRDGYNQLKTLAQKQNDRGMYLHYQAEELKSYHETLKGEKNHRATRFQLWAMSVSNNYGTSWWKGVKFVAGINLTFVIVCFWHRTPQFDCSGIGNFFNLYLSSLSLISIPKILSTDSNWEMNWFYISRIPLAFGIYQTIAAFRKFGKSE